MKLSKRLKAAADLVNKDCRLADIGCDHGYVPVYLVKDNRISHALACDINIGPLSSCRRLVEQEGLSDFIECRLSDGLQNVTADEADDILIAGMGGELIADILSKCDFVKNKHLVLNPMTHPEITRKWLYDNGFDINNDLIVADGAHHYIVLDAVYTGVKNEHSTEDYYLGSIKDFSDKEYFYHLLNYLENKSKGGGDYSQVISAIEKKL